MEIYRIYPTSANSAECDPIVLRETPQRRLVFKPVLVENPHNSDAPVSGNFVYQRKRQDESWEDHNELHLSKLKASEWIKVDHSAQEVYDLLHHLGGLYRLYRRHGVPRRKLHLLRVEMRPSDAQAVSRLDMTKILELSRTAGTDLIQELLTWVTSSESSAAALRYLSSVGPDALQKLNAMTGLATLKRVLQEWKNQLGNDDEEWWQQQLKANSFVLTQVFAHPLIIIDDKAYVGGKGLANKGGKLADFLATSTVTHNALVIEIKTPKTALLGRPYRQVFSLSQELSGGIIQALSYRTSLMQNIYALKAESPEPIEATNCDRQHKTRPRDAVKQGHSAWNRTLRVSSSSRSA